MYTTYRRENVLPQDTGGLTNQCCLYEYQVISSVRHRHDMGERGGSVVECRTPEREVGGSIPTAAVLCL